MSEENTNVIKFADHAPMNDATASADIAEEAQTPVEPPMEPAESEIPEAAPDHVPTEDEIKDMTVEEQIETMEKYTKAIDINAKKATMHKELDSIYQQRNEMGKLMKAPEGGGDPMESINRKLDTVKDAAELADMIKDPEKLAWFFEDDETGEEIELMTPEQLKDLHEFQRDLLLFMKRCDDATLEYERMSAEIDQELKNLNAEIEEVNSMMQNNILTFTDAIEKTITADHPMYNQAMREVRGIRSAYTFEILKDLVKEHPSIITNTLYEFNREGKITDIGRRYATKLDRAETSANLITFLPKNTNDMSIEKHIIPNEYVPGTEDLFVYILIRHFAMSSFDDVETKKFHAAVYLMMYQLIRNQLKPDQIQMVHDNILELMQMYYEKLPAPGEEV